MNLEVSHILIALVTYFIATLSPGPANIAIMDLAMHKGRKPAFTFALGVLLGSFVWAMLAILGVAVLLSTYSSLLYVLKILGAAYLFWLSYKTLIKIRAKEIKNSNKPSLATKKLFLQGLAVHVTNPKAIFTWVAIVSLALPQSPSTIMSLIVVLGCVCIGIIVFGGYAFIFSTAKAQRIYRKFNKWLNGITGIIFALAGFKLLYSQN